MNATKRLLALILSPLSLLYGIGVSLRNMVYDTELTKSSKFSLPVIGVGNLAIGGAGKTPHVEYLISLLQPYINTAILSRGYNRSTSGFMFVSPQHSALDVGDEPLMYARRYRDVVVAVGENRAIAIPLIMRQYPQIQTIILDDAFQHRSVMPYINIMLTQYELPYYNDFLLPSGRLREWRQGYKRADIIIITKCPDSIDENTKNQMISFINPLKHQRIFFSKYAYQNMYHFYDPSQSLNIEKDHDVILISAIANTNYLNDYIASQTDNFLNMEYADHHNFTERDIHHIIDTFKARQSTTKYIITTEKDAVRLQAYSSMLYESKIPIYVLPVKVVFLNNEGHLFDEYIKSKLQEFKS
jgi:tetraacyldisaccharide 4'-kinase